MYLVFFFFCPADGGSHRRGRKACVFSLYFFVFLCSVLYGGSPVFFSILIRFRLEKRKKYIWVLRRIQRRVYCRLRKNTAEAFLGCFSFLLKSLAADLAVVEKRQWKRLLLLAVSAGKRSWGGSGFWCKSRVVSLSVAGGWRV